MARLSDICLKIGSGATPTGGKSAYLMKGISLIRSQNVLDISFAEDGLAYISDEQARKLQNVEILEGDILLNITGDSVARVCIVPNHILPARVNQHVAIIRVDKTKADNNYILYSLIKSKKTLLALASAGSTRNALTKKMIEEFEVFLPSLAEQKRIASILSSLDDKIAVNRRINANLEAQAQALFKSWFVDFTPFKDQPFVDSELGPIPQGWKVGTLFDVANLHDRYRRPLSSNQRSLMAKKYPYYGATSLMDFVEDYIFDGEYVLMGEDGSVVTEKGYPFIQYVWGKIWVNNHAHVLSGKDGFPTELLIPFLKTYNIKGLVTGAVQAKLNQANMAQIQIPIPPKKNINNLSVIIKSIYKKYRLLTEENQRLAALRDTLLPKLMSGEIKL